jgi:uncharacterized protein
MDAKSSTAERHRIEFTSGDDVCVAWHYPSRNGACVVMASGLAVTRGPGTDAYAAAFFAAGFGVLAFDFRRFGDSGGSPRQVARITDMRDDLRAAVECARSLPGIDGFRVALWGFSLAGGLVIEAASRDSRLAAVIAQSPLVDGRAAASHAMAHQSIGAATRLAIRAVTDAIGATVGRAPRMTPLAGKRGTVALLTTPDAFDAGQALDPHRHHPEWRQEVAARVVLSLPRFRPGRLASSVSCPVLVVAGSDDHSVPITATRDAIRRAPIAELVEIPGGHYAPFIDGFDLSVATEIAFLQRHAIEAASATNVGANR